MILYIGVLRAVDSVGCVVALRPDVDKQEERTLTRTETSVIFESWVNIEDFFGVLTDEIGSG
jgi:hypothetical protein